MSNSNKLQLISFKVCPFAQRAAIALQEKKVAYETEYLVPGEDQPEWFKQISPLGKVPVLVVDGTPVFESAVILEYLDEVYAPQLHPADPLAKARQRAWMEVASELFGKQYLMVTSKEQAGFETAKQDLQAGLERVAKALSTEEPFFNGSQFALVDVAFAPLFVRLDILEQVFKLNLHISPRIEAWRSALLAKDSVKNSVVTNFEEVFMMFVKKSDGYLVNKL
ncbi:glutathione S-transferase family protein [uncultured Thiothrix sp.]|uniref:glutathione S-transferase family protein n=1 Tax=uncultured Thiothrix sp. TaxID=223185 RepID=UPI0026105BB5|nr:glutathione S-transferase family protein [uncultured Thiothrix sp.]